MSLLALSEEVLVRLVRVGRFTLTDIGNLRATCVRLWDFLTRIHDTVNECVVGDLRKYRPYGRWNIDGASLNGHFDLVCLLFEDDAKRGRVSRCTNDALCGALAHGRWDMFVHLLRSCECDHVGLHGNDGPWENLTRAQVLFVLDDAPRDLRVQVAHLVVKSALRRGDVDHVLRLLPLAHDSRLPLEEAMRVHAQFPAVFDAVVDECVRRGVPAVDIADRLFHTGASATGCGCVLIDLALARSPVALECMPEYNRRVYADAAADAGVIARLRERGLKRTVANFADDVVYSVMQEGAKCGANALASLLLGGDYEAAKIVAPSCDDRGALLERLLGEGAAGAIEWCRAEGLLDRVNVRAHLHYHRNSADLVSVPCVAVLERAFPTEFEIVVNDYCIGFLRQAAARGDVAAIRSVCERVDVRHWAGFATQWCAESAAEEGHYDVLSYMIDVNARNASVRDADGLGVNFDVCSLPFYLFGASDVAVRKGHFRLARMIDRRVPGLRPSLAAACEGRRWRVFHWALARLDPSERDGECDAALVACVRNERMEFVRWFEENEPACVRRCVPKFWHFLEYVRDESFWYALLSKHAHAARTHKSLFWVRERCTNVHVVWSLERRLGVELVERPFPMAGLVKYSSVHALRAAIELGIPLTVPTRDEERQFPREMWEWTSGRISAGEFVLDGFFGTIQRCVLS